MDIHTQFKSFQENQTKQFFEFQKNQFQEFMALFPDRALSKSNVIAVKPVTVNVIKPKKKVKRSANAYAFFTKKNRASIKEENPDATFGELASLVGSAWKALSEEERKPFIELAEEAKAQLKTDDEE
ncbi:HMG-box domain-containing protein [Crocinitomicaceae bacterium]|nr:HMG-box domain-containing protein [Crocinitomicaceae bacterium]